MEMDVLLQRQMELHGMLRRPPRDAAQLCDVHGALRDLVGFFADVRETAEALRSAPETVFQCLMHIGLGDAVSFDKQRRDGAVPMHQAKVLTRAGAIELEPRLCAALPAKRLDAMVALSKRVRAMLRVKMEDGNDCAIAERALKQSLEYLDWIDAAAAHDASQMMQFYMVGDEASLRALLQGAAERGIAVSSANSAVSAVAAEVEPPNDAHLCGEVRRLALTAAASTAAPGDRLEALRRVTHWVEVLPDARLLPQLPCLIADMAEPVASAAGEKRSAICRQACSLITALAQRTPARLYSEHGVRVALGRWCQSLVPRVFVTVSAIAVASDAALRALVVGSRGHAVGLRAVLTGLEAGAQPELRRRCVGYLALGVIASRGEAAAMAPELRAVAQRYAGVGDTGCRRMARCLAIALEHVTGAAVDLRDAKAMERMTEETAQLRPALNDAAVFERTIFSESRTSVNSTGSTSVGTNSIGTNSPGANSFSTGGMEVYDTTTTLGPTTPAREAARGNSLTTRSTPVQSSSLRVVNSSRNDPTPPQQPPAKHPVKLSTSLRQKIGSTSKRQI